MFFVLSKLLLFALLPAVWLTVGLVLALVARTPLARRRWLRITAGAFLVLTNPLLSNQAWLAWEVPPVPLAQVPPHDVAILLTGITSRVKSPQDRIYIARGADRVLHTLLLWRRGRCREILIAGGSGALRPTAGVASEAAELRGLLRMSGVPDSVIFVEETSRNTRENALNVARLLLRHPHWQRRLLVTSGFHMRRAVGCFQRAGVNVTPFSTDFSSADQTWDPAATLIPTEGALYNWGRLLHEITGWLMYKGLGYC